MLERSKAMFTVAVELSWLLVLLGQVLMVKPLSMQPLHWPLQQPPSTSVSSFTIYSVLQGFVICSAFFSTAVLLAD
jgi:hypothetical protein